MALAALTAYLRETEDYRHIFEHLSYDQQTYLPDGANGDRARQLGLLEERMRERTAAAALGTLIEAVEATEPDPGKDFETWAIARVARRDHDAERARPLAVLREFQETGAAAFTAWRDARRDSDWAAYAPWLAKLVDLNKRIADAVGYPEHPMDALLSLYDPAPGKRVLDALFASLKDDIIGLNQRRQAWVEAAAGGTPEPVPDRATLFAFARDVATTLGYEWNRGGLAVAPHPFTSPAGANDVRFTIRDDVPFEDTLKAIVHELGHCLYEQGVGLGLRGTSAGRGIMPYIHESQSKFWENIIGRTPEFAELAHGMLRKHVPDLPPGFTAERLHELAVAGPTSLIRTATDELTFNLHIMLRWEIECALLDGNLAAADVPDLWNARAKEYFDQDVRTGAEGALQDPHWCRRYFGLFTSYVIGNLASAQLAQAMTASGVDLRRSTVEGDYSQVLAWLRANVHGSGRTFTVDELLARATGAPLSAEAYRAHLNHRYGTETPQS